MSSSATQGVLGGYGQMPREITDAPGIGLPLDHKVRVQDGGFPTNVEDYHAEPITLSEGHVLQYESAFTNFDDWRVVLTNQTVLNNRHGQVQKVVTPPGHTFTNEMTDLSVKELVKKSDFYGWLGWVPVMDTTTCVIRARGGFEKRETLKLLVHELETSIESVAGRANSNGAFDGYETKAQAYHIIDPYMYPLLYSTSRIAHENVPLSKSLEYNGHTSPIHCSGFGLTPTLPISTAANNPSITITDPHQLWSDKAQLLPCNVEIVDGAAKIVSYINNLHPTRYPALYQAIEDVLTSTLPLFAKVYKDTLNGFVVGRVDDTLSRATCSDCGDGGCAPDDELYDDGAYEEYTESHPITMPRMLFDPSVHITYGSTDDFNGKRLQFIIRLTTIDLTPQQPAYEEHWHTDGIMNEHICATAMYFFDSENVTKATMAFETRCSYGWEQGKCVDGEEVPIPKEELRRVFGDGSPQGYCAQCLGRVEVAVGRLVVYPNVLRNRIEHLELADKGKGGHCKMLVLHLVDPAVVVTNTANIPPQQEHWYDRAMASTAKVISVEDAEEQRAETVSERCDIAKATSAEFEALPFYV